MVSEFVLDFFQEYKEYLQNNNFEELFKVLPSNSSKRVEILFFRFVINILKKYIYHISVIITFFMCILIFECF